MSVTATWPDPSGSPPDTLSGATLTQTAWEDVLSALYWLGGVDGKSGQHGGLPFFRNTADKGKEIQMSSGAGGTNHAANTVAFDSVGAAITFPVAFSSAPTVVFGGSTNTMGTGFATGGDQVTGSGFELHWICAGGSTPPSVAQYLAVGAP